MRFLTNQVVWKLSIVFYTALTFILSSIKEPDLGLIRIEKTDWLLHGIEFGILAYLLLRYFFTSGRDISWFRIIAVTLIYCAIVGALNELLQSQIPGRTPSIVDEVANISGAVLVIAVYRLSYRIH